jgi:hypothetical protein
MRMVTCHARMETETGLRNVFTTRIGASLAAALIVFGVVAPASAQAPQAAPPAVGVMDVTK